jgi:hypothetical protein
MTQPVTHKPSPYPTPSAVATSGAAKAPSKHSTASASATAPAHPAKLSNAEARALIETEFHLKVVVDEGLQLPPDFFWKQYRILQKNPSQETLRQRVYNFFSFGQAPAAGSALAGHMHTLIDPLKPDSKALTCCAALSATAAAPLRVAVSCGANVEVRESATNRCVFQTNYATPVMQLATSQDGQFLASVLKNGRVYTPNPTDVQGHIKLANVVLGKHVCTLRAKTFEPDAEADIEGCGFTPPNSVLKNSLVAVYNVRSERRTTVGTYSITAHKTSILANIKNFITNAFALAPSGNQLFMLGSIVNRAGQIVRLAYHIDLAQKKCLEIPCPVAPDFFGPVHMLAISDTQLVVCCQLGFKIGLSTETLRNMAHSLILFDLTAKTSTNLDVMLGMTSMELGPNNTLFVATSENQIRMYDLTLKQKLPNPIPLKPIEVHKAPNEVQFVNRALRLAATTNSLFFSTNQTGVVNCYDLSQFRVTKETLEKFLPKRKAETAAAGSGSGSANATASTAQLVKSENVEPEHDLGQDNGKASKPNSSLELHLSFSLSQGNGSAAADDASSALTGATPRPSKRPKLILTPVAASASAAPQSPQAKPSVLVKPGTPVRSKLTLTTVLASSATASASSSTPKKHP